MTLRRQIDDSIEKVKLRKYFNNRKILGRLGYGALVAFAIWLVIGLVTDYFSHIGADTPLAP